jgi:hypothetical protein
VFKEILVTQQAEKQMAVEWNEIVSSFAWRLHPASIVKDLKLRAGSSRVPEADRSKALTALAFMNTREAVNAMIELSKSTLADVAEQATWVAFRQGNDRLTSWTE